MYRDMIQCGIIFAVKEENDHKNERLMGTGKVVRCKACGHEWILLKGKGMLGQSAPKPLWDKDGKIICPNCKSTNIEDVDTHILWD